MFFLQVKREAKAGTVFAGLGIAAAFTNSSQTDFKLFPSEIGYAFKSYAGSQIGIQVLPALAGVGFICGPKISKLHACRRYSELVRTYAGNRFCSALTLRSSQAQLRSLNCLQPTDRLLFGATTSNTSEPGAVATGGMISLIKSFPADRPYI